MVQCTSARKSGSLYLVLVPFLTRRMLRLRDARPNGFIRAGSQAGNLTDQNLKEQKRLPQQS
jgi:hypothetical protein